MFTSTAATAPPAESMLIPNAIATSMLACPCFSGVDGAVELPANLRVRDVQSDELLGSATVVGSVQNLVNALATQVVSAADLAEAETALAQVFDFVISIVV